MPWAGASFTRGVGASPPWFRLDGAGDSDDEAQFDAVVTPSGDLACCGQAGGAQMRTPRRRVAATATPTPTPKLRPCPEQSPDDGAPLLGTASTGSELCTPIPGPQRSPWFTPSPKLLATPDPTCRRIGGGFRLESTPEASRRNMTTPPPCHASRGRTLDEDIEAALEDGSLWVLQLALTCGHACSSPHCVHEAVKRNNVRALEFLLERGAPDFDDLCRGQRPLHVALQVCVTEGDVGYRMMELLLQHGANPGFVEGDRFTGKLQEAPIHDAARRGCAPAVELLLRFGASPNAEDAARNTPLHILCQQTAPWSSRFSGRVVSLLLRAGAIPTKENSSGHTPSRYAWDHALQAQMYRAERWFGRVSLALSQGHTGYQSCLPWLESAAQDDLVSPTAASPTAAAMGAALAAVMASAPPPPRPALVTGAGGSIASALGFTDFLPEGMPLAPSVEDCFAKGAWESHMVPLGLPKEAASNLDFLFEELASSASSPGSSRYSGSDVSAREESFTHSLGLGHDEDLGKAVPIEEAALADNKSVLLRSSGGTDMSSDGLSTATFSSLLPEVLDAIVAFL